MTIFSSTPEDDYFGKYNENDTIYGNGGNHYIYTQDGNHLVYGGVGSDFLIKKKTPSKLHRECEARCTCPRLLDCRLLE